MNKNIIQLCSRMVCLTLLLPYLSTAWARFPNEPNEQNEVSHTEAIINGIRYFEYNSSLRGLGFTLNPADDNTFIAPDGKVVPRFDNDLCVVAMNTQNGSFIPPASEPSSYSGDLYVPDYIENFYDRGRLLVLRFLHSALGKELISVRTPLYMPIVVTEFKEAVNLKKAQIGACHTIEPYSFMNCAKLETVIFEQAPYIYEYAFTDCTGIKSIVLQSETELPLPESESIFEDCVYTNATVYVPDNLMKACKSTPVWSRFTNVKSLKECSVELVKP